MRATTTTTTTVIGICCATLLATTACGVDGLDGPCVGVGAALSTHEMEHAEEAAARGERVALTVHEPAPVDEDDGRMTGFAVDRRPTSTIYLNRGGGRFTAGSSDATKNRTAVVAEGCVEIAPFPHEDRVWADVMSCVQDQFARFDVRVVDEEPTDGDYVEAVLGGAPGDLGLPAAVAGIAPMDAEQCGVLERAVVFVFAGALPESAQLVCEVAAQEIAHAYGLDHQYLCEDPMSYLRGCGEKTFQNVDAACGEHGPRDCMCGRRHQNSAQLLADVLGTKDGAPLPAPLRDGAPPTVEVLAPVDGETLDGEGVVEVIATAADDVSVSRATLLWEETGDEIPCPARGSRASCERIGDTYAWRLHVGAGPRAFRVEATDHLGATTSSPRIEIDLRGDEGSAAAGF